MPSLLRSPRAPHRALPALALGLMVLHTSAAEAPPRFDSMDRFVAELQSRASQALGNAEDFQVTPTGADFGLGTLLRPGTTIPIDYTACKPSSEPPSARVPNLFPRYQISRGVAVDFALDPAALGKLGELGVKTQDSDTVELTVRGARIQTLSDVELSRIAARPECAELLRGRSAWIVRGYVRGQRSFLLRDVDTTRVTGALAKLFRFSVSAGPGTRSLDLADSEDTAFLQIVSAIGTAPGGALVLRSPAQQADAEQATRDRANRPASSPRPKLRDPAMSPEQAMLVFDPPAASGSGSVSGEPTFTVVRGIGERGTASQRVAWEIERLGAFKRVKMQDVPGSALPPRPELRVIGSRSRATEDTRELLARVQRWLPDAVLRWVPLPAPLFSFELWLPRDTGP
jgi:hypothetical protein